MALTYADTAALMTDQAFIGRSRIACLHYASYISGEDYSVPAYNTRQRWANATFQNPDAATLAVLPVLVMDDKVQIAGAAITDADLQSALETSVNKMF